MADKQTLLMNLVRENASTKFILSKKIAQNAIGTAKLIRDDSKSRDIVLELQKNQLSRPEVMSKYKMDSWRAQQFVWLASSKTAKFTTADVTKPSAMERTVEKRPYQRNVKPTLVGSFPHLLSSSLGQFVGIKSIPEDIKNDPEKTAMYRRGFVDALVFLKEGNVASVNHKFMMDDVDPTKPADIAIWEK